MAVSRLWSVTVHLGQVIDYATNPEKTSAKVYTPEQYQALADVLAYAKDEEKTEKEFYVEGINCNPLTARDQFITVKEQYDKKNGIQAYHGYLSFKENELTPAQCQAIGMEFAKRVWGNRFQVVVTTHLNTKHLHCHFVINSVSYVDGKKLQNEEKAWFKFRHIVDEICREHNLSVVENPDRNKEPQYLTKKDKAGMPTRYNVVRQVIDEALSMSKNMPEFKSFLKEMGYTYNLSPNRKYWTVTPKGWEKPIRLYRLGEDYTNERIEKRLLENPDSVRLRQFQYRRYGKRQYSLPTRKDKLKRVGGLKGLYLHYCYRLGYLPKYNQQNNARLHYLLKEDLMKLDAITAEVRLLGKHHIDTAEQLISYKSSVENEIKTLTADRTHLRNEIRKVDIDDVALSKAKEKILTISDRLKELRKEVKLCDGIAERSKVIETNLAAVRADEEKFKGRRTADMNNGGDAAEQIVRLSLEGFEVAAKLSGAAAKNIALLLVSVLKEEQKTKGKARLTNMIKSGKELKVFSIQNKDLKKFTEQAKRYGVLYCVLKDKYNKGDGAAVDIIARAEDASKIQRIVERFELGSVDKASILSEITKDIADREAKANEIPTKSKGEIIVEEALKNPIQKDGNEQENPSAARTEKSPLSEPSSEEVKHSDKGTVKDEGKKPSTREKLERYKAEAKAQKESERKAPEVAKDTPKNQENRQTVHKQPKRKKNRHKSKER